MSNKNEKKSNVWLWILAVLVLIALVVVLILHPWNRSEGDAADTPAVTATAAPAETGTVESNSSLGEADQERRLPVSSRAQRLKTSQA